MKSLSNDRKKMNVRVNIRISRINFIKKENPTQIFSREYHKLFKLTASENGQGINFQFNFRKICKIKTFYN